MSNFKQLLEKLNQESEDLHKRLMHKSFLLVRNFIRDIDDLDVLYSLSDELIVRVETLKELRNSKS